MMLNRLMLGTVQFGLDYGIANRSGQVPYAEVVKILECAIRSGITSLDTAASYGSSEEVLGRALAELGAASQLQLVSKVPALPAGLPDAERCRLISQSLSRSLQRLRVNSLHACLFHSEDDLDSLPLLQGACQSGAARHVGVSLNARRIEALPAGCTAVQIPMNMLDIRYAALATARPAADSPQIYARSAYLQGLLLLEERDIPASLAPLLPAIASLSALRNQYGWSRQEFYLRYMLSVPGIDKIVIGVDSLAQLQDNMAVAARGPLPDAVCAEIRRHQRVLPDALICPSCWKRS